MLLRKNTWKKLAARSGYPLPGGILREDGCHAEAESRRPDEHPIASVENSAVCDLKPAAADAPAGTPAELSGYLKQKGQTALANLTDTLRKYSEYASRYQMWTDHYLPTAVRCIRNLESKTAGSELKEESVQTLRDLNKAAEQVCADIQQMEDMEECAEFNAVRQMLRLNGDLPDGSGFGEKQ